MKALPAVLLLGCSIPAAADGYYREYTVDASLANDPAWIFSDMKSYAGGYCFGKDGAAVRSPVFDFGITSVVITVRGSSDIASRRVFVEPGAHRVMYSAADSDFAVAYPAPIRSFIIRSETGDTGNPGNVYLSRIVLRGVQLPVPPVELSVPQVGGTWCRLRWVNSAGVESNRVTTCLYAGRTGTRELRIYDFGFLKGDGRVEDCTAAVLENFPELEGACFRTPTGVNGVLQLGTSEHPGTLMLPPLEDYRDAILRMDACRHTRDTSFKKLEVGYVADGRTNAFPSVAVPTNGFEIVDFDVSAASAGSRILINGHSTTSDRRLWLRSVGLLRTKVDSWPAVASQVVSYGVSEAPRTVEHAVRGLLAGTNYLFRVTSFIGSEESAAAETAPFDTLAAPDPGILVFIR